MSQYDPKFYLKINIGHCDLILWSSDFALHLEDYLMYEHHTSYVYMTYISWSSDFVLYLQDYLIHECYIFR